MMQLFLYAKYKEWTLRECRSSVNKKIYPVDIF